MHTLASLVIEKVVRHRLGAGFEFKRLVLPLVLVVPLGLVMDFVHEFGHAFWGTAVGGSLSYMQIAYLVVYPRLAMTPLFRLGYVEVTGLSTSFAHGIFLLGGSLTTNLVSWVLGLILWKRQLGASARVSLKILGYWGLLDLPLYVVFPQIGLRHWIVVGGNWPEPLMGARAVGVPDPLLYATVVLSTLGLVLLYQESLRQMVWKRFGEIASRVAKKARKMHACIASSRDGSFSSASSKGQP